MANDILDSLKDLGYTAIDENSLEKCISEGAKYIPFTQMVEWITKELQYLYSLDEHVNALTSSDDSSLFLMELGSFLKEIGCQYSVLMEGRISDNLQSKPNRILLLDYLLTELKSARMLYVNKPDTELSVTLNESGTATDLKNMLLVMKFPKPPANIPPSVLFGKVEAKLKEIISKVPPALIGQPLFTSSLSDKNWHKLEEFYKELFEEYKLRREMLLKRLDVTIQSFEWSDRLKNKSNEIHSSFLAKRKLLSAEPKVRLSDVLAARKDLAILEKTSSASVRRKTQSDVNKVMIGSVPDRGGRPYEQEPPPPEMPSWQQRNAGGGTGGGRGGGRGGRGGGGSNFNAARGGGGNFDNKQGGGFRGNDSGSGRVQAGWNQQSQNSGFQNPYQNPANFDRQNSGGSFSKGYQGRGQYQYQDNSSYDNRSTGRGGYDYDRPRGGQNNANYSQPYQEDYQDRRSYQGNQNRGGGRGNYYRR